MNWFVYTSIYGKDQSCITAREPLLNEPAGDLMGSERRFINIHELLALILNLLPGGLFFIKGAIFVIVACLC